MKRRFTVLAAMLLMTGALMVGMLGIASAQDPVHEADGTWHTDGQVSFKVTWKGVVHVKWEYRVASGTVDSWVVTATDTGGNVKTKMAAVDVERAVSFRKPDKLTIGEDWTVVVKGLDADEDELGSQQVTIRPRRISPPEAATGLTLSVGDDNLSVSADWTAPAAGGMPKRYAVWLTNLETGRARGKLIEVKQGRGGEVTLKTDTAFAGLWPGDRYRVSVQTRNRNSRWKEGADGYSASWQRSEWLQATITMPAGNDPSYAKEVPTLIWEPVLAGETAPPYVIGEPTAYIAVGEDGLEKFDAPSECKDHTNHDHEVFFDKGDEEARKARRALWGQERILDRERGELAAAIAAKQKYLDDTPEADRDAGRIATLDQAIDRHRNNIEAGEKILADLVAKVETECARAYPVVENLTEDDNRWYQVAQTRETEPRER